MRVARLLLTVCIFTGPFTPALCPTSAAGQMPTAAPGSMAACSGKVNLVRVSTIKPGMMNSFLEAVADQAAWYKKTGLDDRIEVMRVMEQDPTTKSWKLSETQAITTHVMPANREPIKHDAAWDTFVAKFGAASTIEKSYVTCNVGPMEKM